MFRFETIGRLSSTAMVFLAVACLAAALPAALLTRKHETVRLAPYLELEVKPAQHRLLAGTTEDILHRGE